MTTTVDKRIETAINKLFPIEKPLYVEYVTSGSYAFIELTTRGDIPKNSVKINIENCFFRNKDLGELIQLLLQIQQKMEMNE